MGKHNETGIKGEQIAENFLQKNSYEILQKNWRTGKMEVDIVAVKNNILTFIEVKTRNRIDFGYPEDAVDARKQDFMKEAAALYMEEKPEFTRIQFDVISILMDNKGQLKELVHIEDAFY